jgi:peptidoglycan/xylan/chitin deacetylase (PgdA/CDA1 family)
MTLLIIFLLFMLFLGFMSLLFFNQNIQIFGPVKNNIKTKQKIVAFSFDDGPNEPYTTEILDIT